MIVTTKVRLPESELTSYLDNQNAFYSKIYRKAYRIMIAEDYKKNFENEYELRNWLAFKFRIPTRLCYTIVSEIKGRLKALREHKKYLLGKMRYELYSLDQRIEDLEEEVEHLKKRASENKATPKQLESLRNKKLRLYALKNKRNTKKQKIENLEAYLKTGKAFRIGFGSRELFKKQFHLEENGYKSHQDWYEDYIFHRDHNVASLGSAAETSGNQLSTLFYNKENGTYSLRLRKFDSTIRGKQSYLWLENLRIVYLGDQIKEIVTGKKRKPLYHRFVRDRKGYYLHLSFDLDCPKTKESGYSGQCGLDYNDSFIELSASDKKGNLIFQKHIALKFHGSGKRAETELKQKISEIVNLCIERNWELIVEDLDFVVTKALRSKGRNRGERRLNKILHVLDYRRYKESLVRASKKAGLKITLINPAYTSEAGFIKFGEQKKLNVHQSASYYISRNSFESR